MMAAIDALNPDLFIRVYHASYGTTPPHEVDSKLYSQSHSDDRIEEVNPTGELVFAGTQAAAHSRFSRPNVHMYDIPKSMIRPELWADDMSTPHRKVDYRFADNPQIFEAVPAQTDLATADDVVQYRNAVEDYGSISHIMHKDAIRSGKIKYVGQYTVPTTPPEDH